MNARPDLSTARAADDCLAGVPHIHPAAALKIILKDAREIAGDEALALGSLLDRVGSADVTSSVSLPRFDNSAVDGFGIHADDLHRQAPLALKIVGRAAAGHFACGELKPSETFRVLTGARIPDGVAAVVLEERTTRSATDVTLHFIPEFQANIRGHGEDVLLGTIVVPKRTVIDSRHLAILASSGIAEIRVKRRLRIGVLSTGDELVEPAVEIGANAIVDSNRPMLLGLLSSPAIQVVDLGIVPDDREAIARVLSEASSHLDLLFTSGGVAGSDADHLEAAANAAGGCWATLKLALRPGKPIGKGNVGSMQILALPGNPVAALVNFLLFGRPLIRALLGASGTDAIAQAARASETFFHKEGRTEFMPVRVTSVGPDGIPSVTKLGRGGSARLLPLVNADGFSEIGPEIGNVESGSVVRYHPFSSAFSL
jgi:molybdopterin molybdotransferase